MPFNLPRHLTYLSVFLAKLEDLSHIHSQLKQIELWFTQNFDDVDLPKFIVNMNQYDSLLGTSQIEDYDRHRRTATDGKESVF